MILVHWGISSICILDSLCSVHGHQQTALLIPPNMKITILLRIQRQSLTQFLQMIESRVLTNLLGMVVTCVIMTMMAQQAAPN